jgi:uncharacterized protein YdeI (YjbR/CyaY-like superfamily)
MPKLDPRVDAYIKKAQPFARPILTHLRNVVHKSCPAVVETVKWGVPHFDYKGPLCGMAAFKEHIRFGFWKGALLKDKLPDHAGLTAGAFAHVTTLADLPGAKVLSRMVADAAKLNDEGVKVTRVAKAPKAALPTPADLMAALKKNQKALTTFTNFAPGRRREYVEWILDAKQDATRAKRIKDAVAWMAEGKIRHWKYAR